MTQEPKAQDNVQVADELFQYAQSLGAELYGVASAHTYATEFPDKPSPTRFIEDARSIIVIGIPFEPGVENCPIGAIDGQSWKNPFACASYGCCGTCIAICPTGEI